MSSTLIHQTRLKPYSSQEQANAIKVSTCVKEIAFCSMSGVEPTCFKIFSQIYFPACIQVWITSIRFTHKGII